MTGTCRCEAYNLDHPKDQYVHTDGGVHRSTHCWFPGGADIARQPIPMLLWCPSCCTRHVDKGEFVTKPHHTHACQNCGMTWRPAIEDTVGVQFLPGFKDERMLPVKIPSPEEIEEGVLR